MTDDLTRAMDAAADAAASDPGNSAVKRMWASVQTLADQLGLPVPAPLLKHRITVDLTVRDDGMVLKAIAGRLQKVIGAEWMADGEDVLGYEGPFVQETLITIGMGRTVNADMPSTGDETDRFSRARQRSNQPGYGELQFISLEKGKVSMSVETYEKFAETVVELAHLKSKLR